MSAPRFAELRQARLFVGSVGTPDSSTTVSTVGPMTNSATCG